MDNEKVYAMSFAKVYPLLTAKAEKKGRTVDEVNEIICWLTGYSTEEIENARNKSVTYGDFFKMHRFQIQTGKQSKVWSAESV